MSPPIRSQRSCSWAIVGLVLLIAVAPLAAESLWEAVPDNALLIAYINNPAKASKTVRALGELVSAPVPPDLLGMARQLSGLGDSLPDIGLVGLVLIPGEGNSQFPFLFLPCEDYPAFLKKLGSDSQAGIAEVKLQNKPVLVARKGSFAVLTDPDSKARLEDVLQAPLCTTRNTLTEILESQDAGCLVESRGVTFFVDQIMSKMELVLNEVATVGDEAASVDRVLELYRGLFSTIKTEVERSLVTVEVMETNDVHLRSRWILRSGGWLSDSCSGIRPPQTPLLEQLPEVPWYVGLEGVIPAAWMTRMSTWSLSLLDDPALGTKLTEGTKRELEEVFADMVRDVRAVGMSLGPPGEGKSFYDTSVAVFDVADAAKYLTTYRESMESLRRMASETELPMYRDVQVEELKLAGAPALHMSMKMPKEYLAKLPEEGQKAMLDFLFGGDTLHVYMAALDETTLGMSYVSQDRLADWIQARRDEPSSWAISDEVTRTQAQLVAGAQWRGFINPQGIFELFRRMATRIPGGIPVPIPEFSETSALGMAAKFTGESIETDLLIPANVLQETGNVLHKAGG